MLTRAPTASPRDEATALAVTPKRTKVASTWFAARRSPLPPILLIMLLMDDPLSHRLACEASEGEVSKGLVRLGHAVRLLTGVHGLSLAAGGVVRAPAPGACEIGLPDSERAAVMIQRNARLCRRRCVTCIGT